MKEKLKNGLSNIWIAIFVGVSILLVLLFIATLFMSCTGIGTSKPITQDDIYDNLTKEDILSDWGYGEYDEATKELIWQAFDDGVAFGSERTEEIIRERQNK